MRQRTIDRFTLAGGFKVRQGYFFNRAMDESRFRQPPPPKSAWRVSLPGLARAAGKIAFVACWLAWGVAKMLVMPAALTTRAAWRATSPQCAPGRIRFTG